jgi:phospholipid transport system substrate-binding protein
MARSDVKIGLLAFLVACAVGITAQFAAPAVWAQNKPDEAARRFVEQVNDASMSFFSSGSDKDAREKCQQLLSWAFDVPAMGEYVLGKAWAGASEEDRKEFLAAFEDEIVGEYLHRMKGGTTMAFVGTRSAVDGDLLAASRVAVTGKNDQIWIWRMRPQGPTWRIVDVTVDGRSAILSERKTYAQVLQANKGDIKALIAYVRSRADP